LSIDIEKRSDKSSSQGSLNGMDNWVPGFYCTIHAFPDSFTFWTVVGQHLLRPEKEWITEDIED